MSADILAELTELAGAVVPAYHAFAERVRALGLVYGIEVLDLRPAGPDGVWEVRVRLGDRQQADSGPVRPAAGASVSAAPEKFVSPVQGSRPFDGDGTVDFARFVEEADAVVRVPKSDGDRPLPRLMEEQRLQMLAGTIAGDALLSLLHAGRHRDPAAVEAALGQARALYAGELERVGSPMAGQLLANFDPAAARLRDTLLREA